jgi:V/A-type H+-transporting ATPase subunit I
MIVRMSKVEIAGMKELLEDTLEVLREEGIFQIETETVGFIDRAEEEYISTFSMDQKALSEKLLLEDMKVHLEELFSLMPEITTRRSYIEPENIIDTLRRLLPGHIKFLEGLMKKKDLLQRELSELIRYKNFMDAIEPIIGGVEKTEEIDFIGLTIKEPEAIPHLRKLLFKITDGRYELFTNRSSDGTLAGVLITEKRLSEIIRKALRDERIPEITLPSTIEGLTFAERLRIFNEKIEEINRAIQEINSEVQRFTLRWKPLYDRTLEWIDERLSIMKATAHVFETRMCFIIYGWMPSDAVTTLSRRLTERFGGRVTLIEKEIFEEDLERIPVMLKNPPYFQPFEVMVRLLPLPRYGTFDPTPFIGLFFPIFFGMILGDAGYGIVLLCLSIFSLRRFKKKKNLQDVSRIIFICSIYSIFFGILYGEFFGEVGHKLFGLEPICIERRTAVIPMLYFALAVGLFHVLIGLLLGVITGIKKRTKKEAIAKSIDILLIIATVIALSALCGIIPERFVSPIITLIIILLPVLIITGGLLAPLELIKTIGNIISYARIMAIGLTSVLLAFVANRLAGMTGNIIAGAVVAGLLHLINIILGVFSPAIHSMRLHYVEFFSKFIEPGGRRFEPFRKI